MEKTQMLQQGKHQEKCKKHGELLEYFCPKCKEAICVTCTCDPQHEEHCDHIVDLKTGLKELKASMNQLCETFKDNVKKVEICSEMLKQDVESVTVIGEVVQVKTKDVCLKDKVEAKVKHVKEMNKEIQTKSEKEQKQGARNTDKNEVEELENIQLMKEITRGGTVNMRNPLEVVSVEDGTVIVVHNELNYLQRIDTQGEVVRKYKVTVSQLDKYRSASVYGDYLFVLTSDDVITKMSLDASGCNIEYKPGAVRIGYISAIGDNAILISGGVGDGRILEYNTETNKVIERVSGSIWNPGKVSVVQDGHHTKYIVKWYTRQVKEK